MLRLIIERADDVVVAGEAASGSEALELVDECDPLVVVIDDMMPDMSGIDVASQMRAKRPNQLVILCTAYVDQAVLDRARTAGVTDCLAKEDLRQLPAVIRQAVAGGPVRH